MKQHVDPSRETVPDRTFQRKVGQTLFRSVIRISSFGLLLFTLFAQTAFVESAFAQDSLPVLCGTLSETDCDILKNSQEVMQSMSAATNHTEMTFSATNVPDAPGDLSVDMVMDMSYYASPEMVQMALEMQKNLPELMSDEAAILEMYGEILGGMSQDLQISVKVSPDLAALAEMDDIPLEEGISFHMLVADSVVYVDMASLGSIAPELALFRGWMGVDLTGFTDMMTEELEKNPEMLSEDSLQASEDPMALMMGAGFGAGYSLALSNPTLIEPAIEIQRLEDEMVNGVDVAVFQTDVDYAALLGDPEFLKALTTELMTQLEASGMPESELPSETELSEMMVGIQMAAPVVLKDLNLSVIQLIGLEDFYLYHSELYFDWDLSSVMMFAEMQDGGNAEAQYDAPVIIIDMVSSYDNFNDVPEIVGPEGAVVLSLEMLMSLAEMQ